MSEYEFDFSAIYPMPRFDTTPGAPFAHGMIVSYDYYARRLRVRTHDSSDSISVMYVEPPVHSLLTYEPLAEYQPTRIREVVGHRVQTDAERVERWRSLRGRLGLQPPSPPPSGIRRQLFRHQRVV